MLDRTKILSYLVNEATHECNPITKRRLQKWLARIEKGEFDVQEERSEEVWAAAVPGTYVASLPVRRETAAPPL